MKQVGTDIYTYLRRNNLIVYSFSIITIAVSSFALYFAYSVYKESKNVIYTYNGQGAIVPLKLLNTKENRIEQVKANYSLFVSYFYNLDPNNWEKQIEKALWLGGTNISEIYQQKNSEGYYNQFIQYSIIQKAEILDIEILNLDEPYSFQAIVYLELDNNGNKKAYKIEAQGTMLNVSINYPNNPFGLLINNYLETSVSETEPLNK